MDHLIYLFEMGMGIAATGAIIMAGVLVVVIPLLLILGVVGQLIGDKLRDM